MNNRFPLLALIVALMPPPASLAQGAAPLATDDIAYEEIDRLEALGVVDSLVVGQRPYSYSEIGRIVLRARQHASSVADPAERELVDGLIERLARRFVATPGVSRPALTHDLATRARTTSAERRALLGSFGRLAEATIDPLAPRTLGFQGGPGTSLALELSHRLDASPAVALDVRERFDVRELRDGNASAGRTTAALLLGGVRARLGNLGVSVGRRQVAWAQSRGDGLFFASDAPALDLVSLSGDTPFRLPWALAALGPAQATLVVAGLGPSQVRSHSTLVAYKVSVLPAAAVEIGGSFMNHFGGAGSRPAGLADRALDLLPFLDVLRRHNYTDTTRALETESDKVLGLDARVRLRGLGGLSVRGEWLVDDVDVHRLSTLLTYDGSHTLRVVIPRVRSAAVSAELFAKHTGVRTYTHGQLQDGITVRGRLLGDELGPNAKAFGGMVEWWPRSALRSSLELRSATYSDADYTGGYLDSASVDFYIRATVRRPNELRDRVVVSTTSQASERLVVAARLGGERIRHDAPAVFRYVADFTVRFRP